MNNKFLVSGVLIITLLSMCSMTLAGSKEISKSKPLSACVCNSSPIGIMVRAELLWLPNNKYGHIKTHHLLPNECTTYMINDNSQCLMVIDLWMSQQHMSGYMTNTDVTFNYQQHGTTVYKYLRPGCFMARFPYYK